MIITQTGIVDIIPEYNRALRPIFCISEGDKASRSISITVKSGGENFTIPGGSSVWIIGKKTDGTIFSYTCSYAGFTVTFPISEQMSAKDGIVLCELRIINGSDVLGSANFVYWVEPSPVQNGTASESDLNVFLEAILGAEKLDRFYANVEDMVAQAVENMQIHEGQTVIDASLSVSGAAADAKATGDMARNFLEALMTETTTEANIASIDDGAGGLPLKQFVGNIQPTQAGSGDPSPDNVRAISGYTGVTVARTSKNLLPVTGNTTTSGGITYTYNDDGSVTATGTATGNVTTNYGHVTLPAGTYLLSGCTGGSTTKYRIRLGNGSYSGAVVAQNYDDDTEFTLEEATDVYARIYVGVATGVNVNITFKPMVRRASATDSTYEPYVGATYPITFPTAAGTVYGGTLNVYSDGSGTLTVDHAYYSSTSVAAIGTPTTSANGNRAGFAIPNATIAADSADFLCSCGTGDLAVNGASSGWRVGTCALYKGTAQTFFRYIFPTSITTGEAALQYLNDHNCEIVLPITNPTTYALSAVQVAQMLQGVNNVWMDANGTVHVTYYANTAIYIDKRIAAIIGADGNAW